MADEFEKPDTRHLVLKPKEIVPTDPVARPGDPHAISVQQIHRQNQQAEARLREGATLKAPAPAPVPAGFKRAEFTPATPVAPPGDPEAIKVEELMRENAAVDVASGWSGYREPPKRKSRRLRDFFLLVGPIDLALLCVILLVRNPATAIFGLAGIVMTTVCLAWIMFFVMDDY